MATDLTWIITPVTEPDYDGVNETIKQVEPCLNTNGAGATKTGRTFSRLDSETDADAKTAIKTILTDLGYTWDTEDGV